MLKWVNRFDLLVSIEALDSRYNNGVANYGVTGNVVTDRGSGKQTISLELICFATDKL